MKASVGGFSFGAEKNELVSSFVNAAAMKGPFVYQGKRGLQLRCLNDMFTPDIIRLDICPTPSDDPIIRQ